MSSRAERRRQLRRGPAFVWLRFADEASACPGCASPRLTVLDALPIVRDARGRRVSFVTGCHECGLLFTNPLRTQAEALDYYSNNGPWAASRAERMSKVETTYVRRLHEEKPRPRKLSHAGELVLDALAPHMQIRSPAVGAKALDFGCGDGVFLNWLQDHGWETYGIEPSTSVAFLRHRHLLAPPQDASFDFGVVHHVLEHVTDPLGILRQLAGALREGGMLFVSVPGLDSLPEHGIVKYCLDGRKHVLCFSEACLTGLLARAGFSSLGRIDSIELNNLSTHGKPLRLRLVARRTSLPLAPALTALRDYARAHRRFVERARNSLVPVRVRAAILDQARERAPSGRARGPHGS
jgi:SAM-dependent methyltransferase